jgi:hypothetical protein
VAEEGVLVGKDFREVRAKGGNPVEVVAVETLSDVEEAIQVAFAATGPLDGDRRGQTPT